jgi:hypothetical protein
MNFIYKKDSKNIYLIADISVVFNWPSSEVFTMALGKFIAWRELAAIPKCS